MGKKDILPRGSGDGKGEWRVEGKEWGGGVTWGREGRPPSWERGREGRVEGRGEGVGAKGVRGRGKDQMGSRRHHSPTHTNRNN